MKIGAIYQHYKGTKVKVTDIVFDSETLEEMVVYIHLEDGVGWVRPKKMFLQMIEKNGQIISRFKEIKQKIVVKPTNKKDETV